MICKTANAKMVVSMQHLRHQEDTMNEQQMVEVRMPGRVYDECFDPLATDVPDEEGWPSPEQFKIGGGRQFRYMVKPADAVEMLDHAEVFGEAISSGVDDGGAAGRMVLRWVARERGRLGIPE